MAALPLWRNLPLLPVVVRCSTKPAMPLFRTSTVRDLDEESKPVMTLAKSLRIMMELAVCRTKRAMLPAA